MPQPKLETVPPFYHNYIRQVVEDDVLRAIGSNTQEALTFFRNIPAEKWDYRYADDKWTIKEMLQHMIDTDRVFSYRAVCIARGEKGSLPGFDEKEYAAQAKANRRPVHELMEEFGTLRTSIQQLYQSFDDEQLEATGVANGKAISVNAIGFIIAGHARHHLNVLKERYL
jgi:uncharacterized damage-inducible protein DinB